MTFLDGPALFSSKVSQINLFKHLFYVVNWKIIWSGIYLCNAIVLFLAVFFPFFLLPVCNVARFVTSVYLDKKFIVLCHGSILSKTSWSNVLSVVSDYIQFVLFFLSDHWSWGMLFTTGLKGFLGGLYYALFLVCIFELIFFSLKSNNLLQYWFVEGYDMLKHLIIPRNHPNITCFSYICCWIRLLIGHYMVILAWSKRPYTRYYYCFLCVNPW